MRKQVRRVVIWGVCGAFLLALAVILTVIIRGGMAGGFVFLYHAIPLALSGVYRDPILIVAFAVAAILLWIAPWEEFGKKEEETNVTRGREIKSFQQAREKMESKTRAKRDLLLQQARKKMKSKLRAQRAQLRSRRQSSRGRTRS